jgi:hypothetical protein
MKEKIEKILKNKLGRDIITFFYQNQSSIDTVGGVSAWVHNERGKVKKVLDDLVKLGVLEEESIGPTKGYCYTRKVKVMKIVRELMKRSE